MVEMCATRRNRIRSSSLQRIQINAFECTYRAVDARIGWRLQSAVSLFTTLDLEIAFSVCFVGQTERL